MKNQVAISLETRQDGNKRNPRIGSRLLIGSLLLLLANCGGSSSDPVAIRLVDQFRPELVTGAPARVNTPEGVAWNFGEPSGEGSSQASANLGWKAGHGVAGLRIRDGRLVGRATNDSPIIYVQQQEPGEGRDSLHSIELRLRVDKGANLGLAGARSGQDVQALVKRQQSRNWPMSSPLVAGDSMQTITVRPQRSVVMSGVHTVLFQPTDAAGAEFEIESIQLISQGEHLARVPSGIGWQGLSEIYRETLVSRSPKLSQSTSSCHGIPGLTSTWERSRMARFVSDSPHPSPARIQKGICCSSEPSPYRTAGSPSPSISPAMPGKQSPCLFHWTWNRKERSVSGAAP